MHSLDKAEAKLAKEHNYATCKDNYFLLQISYLTLTLSMCEVSAQLAPPIGEGKFAPINVSQIILLSIVSFDPEN